MIAPVYQISTQMSLCMLISVFLVSLSSVCSHVRFSY